MITCPNCNHSNRAEARFCAQCGAPLLLQNRYRLERVLGRGGMGTVYLAQDLALMRPVAIKEFELRGLSPTDKQQLESQVKAESEIWRRLQHVALVYFADLFEQSGRLYQATEYIQGQTLEEIIVTHTLLSDTEILEIASQLCDVLRYLHGQRPPVFHRNLKPGNIYRTPTGQLKLTGILPPPRKHERIYLTPGYAPPEQYTGKVDARSDIYAFGATLYHLLTNQMPPDAPGREKNPLVPPRQLNPHISPALENVILKAFALKPKERFKNADQVYTALLSAVYVSNPIAQAAPEPFDSAQPATPAPPNLQPLPQPAPRVGAPTLVRYGRAEYFSPMDVGVPYDLRVGILLQRQGRGLLLRARGAAPKGRVYWTTLRLKPREDEPILRIIPFSSGLQISPPQRDLRVIKNADVFADFRIEALQMPAHGRADLQIDVEYAGAKVKRISLEICAQDQFRLGPVCVPRTYWTRFSVLGAAILSLDSAFGIYHLVEPIALPLMPTLLALGFVIVILLFGFGFVLRTRAAKRTRFIF